MRALRVLSRSLRHYSVEKLKPYRPWSRVSIFPENSLPPSTSQWLYQTRRTLILEPASSQFVKLRRLSDSDSGESLCFISSSISIVLGAEVLCFMGLWCLAQFLLSIDAAENPIGFFITGILEVSLDRPEAKNAIGRETLRGLQHTLEAISRDSSANVMLLRSSVPKVFCAGADLKVWVKTSFLSRFDL